jgi:hypothetical protein
MIGNLKDRQNGIGYSGKKLRLIILNDLING